MELLRELRAGLPAARAEARATARGRLVAQIEAAARPRARRRFTWRSRPARLLAAGAFAALLAVTVLALGVFDDGSRVESAVAQALHRTATVAESDGAAALPPPAPGQFLYTKTKKVELQGWMPNGHQGTKAEPRVFTAHVGDPYPQALVATVVEKWTAPDGTIRQRETLQPVRFFDAADQRRWEAAGSPPPWSFDPRFHDVARTGSGQLVKEFETRKWAPDVSFPDPAELPTDPKALRLAVESGRVQPPWVLEMTMAPLGEEIPARFRRAETIEKLSQVLEKPTTTPALRAAVFNALAEIPGIELEREVTDVAGRSGEAIVSLGEGGLRRDFSFDPDTAELLAKGETVVDPKAIGRAVPVGTPFRQTAYLRSAIVDSTSETGG
ncbi:MAG TPA: CU044_5270 family protein [Solirubrobacterales bacterium]|nr:CU044_5270 family protein [Solirubrobacterales bacterium]